MIEDKDIKLSHNKNDSFEVAEEFGDNNIYYNSFLNKDYTDYEPLDEKLISNEIQNSLERLDTINEKINEKTKQSIVKNVKRLKNKNKLKKSFNMMESSVSSAYSGILSNHKNSLVPETSYSNDINNNRYETEEYDKFNEYKDYNSYNKDNLLKIKAKSNSLFNSNVNILKKDDLIKNNKDNNINNQNYKNFSHTNNNDDEYLPNRRVYTKMRTISNNLFFYKNSKLKSSITNDDNISRNSKYSQNNKNSNIFIKKQKLFNNNSESKNNIEHIDNIKYYKQKTINKNCSEDEFQDANLIDNYNYLTNSLQLGVSKNINSAKSSMQENFINIKNKIKLSYNKYSSNANKNINGYVDNLKTKYKSLLYNRKGDYNLSSIDNLVEIQTFSTGEDHVWVIKESYDGKYIALGCKSGVLKILKFKDLESSINDVEEKVYSINGNQEPNFEIFNKEKNPVFQLLDEQVFREYAIHEGDIIELCWSSNNPNRILTAGCDFYVCLTEIGEEGLIKKFKHKNMVTGVVFLKEKNDNYFISSCFDKVLRIWSIYNEELVNYVNVQYYITSMALFPDEKQIIIGTHTGKCLVYEIKQDKFGLNSNIISTSKYSLQNSHSFEFESNKNKDKITGICFITSERALVTSNDSKVRLIKISNGQVIKEFLGVNNRDTMIKASYDEISNRIICAGDDGKVVIWNNKSLEKEHISLLKHNIIIIDSYEFTNPFSNVDSKLYNIDVYDNSNSNRNDIKEEDNFMHISVCSVFLKDKMLADYCSKINFFTKELFVKNVIVNCSNKKLLQVLVNFEFLKTMTLKYKQNDVLFKAKSQLRIEQ